MSKELAQSIVSILDAKKAADIVMLGVAELTIVADYFVIATATSTTHVRALCEEVEHELELKGIKPGHIEGKATGWVLMDYGSVVVHLFLPDAREMYNLERLWDDGAVEDISRLLSE